MSDRCKWLCRWSWCGLGEGLRCTLKSGHDGVHVIVPKQGVFQDFVTSVIASQPAKEFREALDQSMVEISKENPRKINISLCLSRDKS